MQESILSSRRCARRLENIQSNKQIIICRKTFQNFDNLRKSSLSKIKNFSELDTLPNVNPLKNKKINKKIFEENILIKKIDYYFSNAIARSSKTMSDCRQAKETLLKNGASL